RSPASTPKPAPGRRARSRTGCAATTRALTRPPGAGPGCGPAAPEPGPPPMPPMPGAACATATPTGRSASSRAQRHPGEAALADVLAVRPDQPVVRVLLDDVRRPARHPADREDGGEQVRRDAQVVVDRGREEVHVRVETLLGEHDLLYPARHPVVRVVARGRA